MADHTANQCLLAGAMNTLVWRRLKPARAKETSGWPGLYTERLEVGQKWGPD